MKTRTITLTKRDIFFDIDKLSLSLSRVSGGDDVRRADDLATDTVADERIFTRLSDRRVAELRNILRKFLSPETAASAGNTLVTSDYAISLSVTDELQDNTLDAIVKLMHDYVVKGTLADWYSDVGTGPVEALSAEANGALEQIRSLIYYRPIPAMQ